MSDVLWRRVQTRHAEKHAASVNIRAALHSAESRLLAGLRDELTAPERFEQFKREVRRLLDAERGSPRDQDRELASRLAQLDSEIGNITKAIASGLLQASPAVAARLHGAETERATLTTRTEARAAKIAELLPPRLAADYIRLVVDLETALQRDVDRAKHSLRALLGRVRLMPDA